MGVLTLSSSGSLTFRAPKIEDGGNNKTYSGSYTFSGGTFQEAILGYAGTLDQIGLFAIENASTGGTLYMAGSNGEDSYSKTITFGNSGQEYTILTSTTADSNIWQIANQQRVVDRYFGGTSPNVYQVWHKITEKYGEHEAFGWVYSAQNYPGLPDPIKPGDDPNGVKGCITSFNNVVNRVYSPVTTWGLSAPPITAPDFVQDYYDIAAWILFGDPVPENHLRFHVYVDGVEGPNIAVRYEAVTKEDDFSLQVTNAQVSAYMDPYVGEAEQHRLIDDPEKGVKVINRDAWFIDFNNYTWGGSKYNRSYIAQNEDLIGHLTNIQKLIMYGGDIADNLWLYLQFTHQDRDELTLGQMFKVNIPFKDINQVSDIVVSEETPTAWHNTFTTSVEIHLGPPPDQDKDDDDDYPDPDPVDPDFDDGETGGFPGNAILTKTYAMTGAKLQNVGTKLWTQSYFDVLKIQSNPIENIVGCKWYPFSVTGTDTEIQVGDVPFGIRADVISTKYVATIGTYTYTGPFDGEKTWMAMSPYTTVKLHLPYVGIVQLDPTEIFGRQLSVKYTIDLITGDCLVLLYLTDGDTSVPYMSIPGSVGVDIPLTSTNRVQSELRAASAGLSAGMSAAAHVASEDYAGAAAAAAGGFLNIAGTDYTCQRTANHNSACSTWENQYIYVEIWYHPNAEADSIGFKKLHGLPCHKYCSIASKQLSGYVQADQRTKIDFAMTAEENRMLEAMVKNGVYVD